MLQCHATSVKFNENFVYLYTSEEIPPYFYYSNPDYEKCHGTRV